MTMAGTDNGELFARKRLYRVCWLDRDGHWNSVDSVGSRDLESAIERAKDLVRTTGQEAYVFKAIRRVEREETPIRITALD